MNTPTAGPARLDDVKLTLLCKAARPTHPISLKTLTEINFAPAKADDRDAGANCHACRRTLTNSADVHVLNPCGHAICAQCVTTLARPSEQCPTCDAKVKRFIRLSIDGTGYSSKGGVEITKKDVVLR